MLGWRDGTRRQISAAARRGARCAAATGGRVQCARSAGCVQRAARTLGVRGPEAVGPALFDLAEQLKARPPWLILAWRPGAHRGGGRDSLRSPQSPIRGPLTRQDLDYGR